MLVYLAGPITGLSYDDCVDWRQKAVDYLREFDIIGLSPLRGKEYLKHETNVSDNYDHSESALIAAMSGQRGIYYRDKFDCHRAGIVLVNMLGAKRVSIGTVMEIAWAAGNNIPVVLIMENEGNVHEHSMLREACAFRVDNLDDALHITVAILAPGKKA
jgi:nucleoside 2-deoxyribosyltransferase